MDRPFTTTRILLVIVALVASGCAAQSAAASDATFPTSLPSTKDSPATTIAALPRPRPSETTTTQAPPDPHRTLIATASPSITSLVVHDAPDGDPIALPFGVPNPHQFGGALTLMITQGSETDDWVEVQLPVKPNGQTGWIDTADYFIHETFIRAEVDLSDTSVKIFDRDELISESLAAIGTDVTPTPLGTFYVAAKRRNPPAESYLGDWALVLSAFSETLESFSGGLPVIAIHGSNNPEQVLGRAISNGCVRVPNDVIQFLAQHVPIGAPVHISA